MSLQNNIEILYEDEYIIVCVKPLGVSSQTERGFDPDMMSILSNYLGRQAYIGVVHRLDKPVSGVMVYAKTKSAAAFLSKKLAGDSFSKNYYAIAATASPLSVSADYIILEDYLLHNVKQNFSSVVSGNTPDAKKATLEYKVASSICMENTFLSLLDIHLLTGRHHQIRVQLSHADMAILGDRRYGCPDTLPAGLKRSPLCLHAYNLSFEHPVTHELMNFSAMPKGNLWRKFE